MSISFCAKPAHESRTIAGARNALAALLCILAPMMPATAIAAGMESASAGAPQGYRQPGTAVTRLLTASPPPEPMLHGGSGRVALLFREPVIRLERLSRPFLGLAGYRFDPLTRTSGVEPLVERVELVRVEAAAAAAPVEWRPTDGMLLDHVHFSPDGRYLSALLVGDGPARLAVFDVETAEERILPAEVNPAWGDPCTWVAADSLLCRLVPANRGGVPAPRIVPDVVEHLSGPAPTRVYSNLLESAHEDVLFEYYFAVELGRVGIDGSVRRMPATRGLISNVEPSPDGRFAVLARIERPFSHLVPARRFPTSIEAWDLARGERRYASSFIGYAMAPEQEEREEPRRFAWKPGSPITLGWIERTNTANGKQLERWMVLEEPFKTVPREIARSDEPIRRFGWTTAGTPYFTVPTGEESGVRVNVVSDDGVREIWSGSTTDRYGNPGRAVQVDGDEGPVLEVNGRIFLAGDGLGPGGAQPFLDVLDLRSLRNERVFTAEPGVFEVVLGVLDPNGPVLLTSRETESEPPNLYVVRGSERTALRPFATPYPGLANVQRRVVTYERSDGVSLSGTLYLPAGWKGDAPLPTLLWIYPYEFTDREQAEQLDVRGFQFHKVKGPSPLSLVLEGYAVLLNPTVPIVYEGGAMSDDYIPQLVASAEAAVDYLVQIGVAEPGRLAVAGRSYGAFSSANLLVHSRLFATAIAMSGAYNRTLTPFGFQHEKRTFWEATEVYANISPFFHADQIEAPILLVHGGADENPGTPTLQAKRFLNALVGEGVPVRYVELPFEGHHYWARENVLHAAAEMIDWLDRTIGRPGSKSVAEIPASPR